MKISVLRSIYVIITREHSAKHFRLAATSAVILQSPV